MLNDASRALGRWSDDNEVLVKRKWRLICQCLVGLLGAQTAPALTHWIREQDNHLRAEVLKIPLWMIEGPKSIRYEVDRLLQAIFVVAIKEFYFSWITCIFLIITLIILILILHYMSNKLIIKLILYRPSQEIIGADKILYISKLKHMMFSKYFSLLYHTWQWLI